MQDQHKKAVAAANASNAAVADAMALLANLQAGAVRMQHAKTTAAEAAAAYGSKPVRHSVYFSWVYARHMFA